VTCSQCYQRPAVCVAEVSTSDRGDVWDCTNGPIELCRVCRDLLRRGLLQLSGENPRDLISLLVRDLPAEPAKRRR
jgi:hypothetical protein